MVLRSLVSHAKLVICTGVCVASFFWQMPSAISAVSEASTAQMEARALLEKGDLPAAIQSYRQIDFKSELWTEKLEDLIRYHLTNPRGLPVEAWRLVQIGLRTGKNPEHWKDYERLSIFLSRACPLASSGFDPSRQLLLDAASYRYATQILADAGDVGGHDDSATNLVSGLTPYLSDIPRMTLVKGQGCRLAKSLLGNEVSAKRKELGFLVEYLKLHSGTSIEELRLENIFILLRADEVAKSLNQPLPENFFPEEKKVLWTALPAAERLWLFRHYFGATKLAGVEAAKQRRAQQIALEVMGAESTPQTPLWLAMVDLPALPPAERINLLSRAEKMGSFGGRAWVLYELARTHYEKGNPLEALTVLRRLLVEKEEELEPLLEETAVNLASRLFSEYRLDQRVLGSVRAAVPSRLWGSLIDRAQIHAAFNGRVAEFRKLRDMTERQSGIRIFRKLEIELAEDLVSRNLKAFRRRLDETLKQQRSNRDIIHFSAALASELVALADAKVQGIQPFAHALAESLKKMPDSEELSDLIQVLGSSQDEWLRGSRSVRKGVLQAGVAKWSAQAAQPFQFQLQFPPTLARRELIHIPDQIGGRGWKLQTAPR